MTSIAVLVLILCTYFCEESYGISLTFELQTTQCVGNSKVRLLNSRYQSLERYEFIGKDLHM